MGTVIWKGDSSAVAQVWEAEIDGYDASTTYGITINGRTVSVAGTTDAATTVAALIVALNASTYPEFTEITWAEGSTSTHVKGTADTAGVPFVAKSYTSGGTGTMDPTTDNNMTEVTANAGPNAWSTATNWDTGAVPVNSDDVIVENSAADILYGLDQSAVTLTSLTIKSSFTGKIGVPRTNSRGYVEYRDSYLAIGATTCTIGEGEGTGSGRCKINFGTAQTTCTVYQSGSRFERSIPATLLKGTHASNVLNVLKGDVGVAFFEGETATVATLRQGYETNVNGDTAVVLGPGCTLTTITKSGGDLEINSNLTTLTNSGGETDIVAGTPGTITVTGGSVRYRTSGTCTTLTVGPGEVDFSRDLRAVTVTNCTIKAGAVYSDPHERVTWTNPAALQCALKDISLDLGHTFNLQRS